MLQKLGLTAAVSGSTSVQPASRWPISASRSAELSVSDDSVGAEERCPNAWASADSSSARAAVVSAVAVRGVLVDEIGFGLEQEGSLTPWAGDFVSFG